MARDNSNNNGKPRSLNPQKKKSSSYFKRQVENNGADFLNRMNSFQMTKEYMAVARDLCSGFFDPVKDGAYFMHPEFMQAMLNASAMEANFYESNAVALNFYVNNWAMTYGSYAIDPTFVTSINRNTRYANIHKTINYYLYYIKQSGNYAGWFPVLLDALENICKVSGPPQINIIDPQQFYKQ